MIEQTTGAPISAPHTVVLGGIAYPLRFTLIAQYEADRLGVDIADFVTSIERNRAGKLATFVHLLTAMLAHNFTAQGKPVPAPEHWVNVLDSLPDAEQSKIFSTVAAVLSDWLKKRALEVKLREPAPVAAPVVDPEAPVLAN